MTDICPSALWPSISPIDVTKGAASATPIAVHDELGEGHGQAAGRDDIDVPAPAHGVPVPPQPHEEVRNPRVARRPVLPTKAEIDEHFPLQLNYRSWCAHCVAGKARLAQHIVLEGDRERIGITIHMDYAFMTPEEVEETMQPTLVIYDDDKKPTKVLFCFFFIIKSFQ